MTKKHHETAEQDDNIPQAPKGLTHEERETRDQRMPLRAVVLYDIIRIEGEGELSRSIGSLWWSGLAAGISIGFSVVAEALIGSHLPKAPWAPLVENFGYSVGFLIVILGRQQLFTESTLTAVLPVIHRRTMKWLLVLLRLWAIVLAANLVGCAIFATALTVTDPLSQPVVEHIFQMGEHMTSQAPNVMFFKAIPAGWLIAALVWILPAAEGNEFVAITLLTYLIALGDFAHVIAGSSEVSYLWVNDRVSTYDAVFQFFLPTLAGNVVGGTALFAVLAYAQVREEV